MKPAFGAWVAQADVSINRSTHTSLSIMVADQLASEVKFMIKRTQTFRKLFMAFCDLKRLPADTRFFYADGRELFACDTVEDSELPWLAIIVAKPFAGGGLSSTGGGGTPVAALGGSGGISSIGGSDGALSPGLRDPHFAAAAVRPPLAAAAAAPAVRPPLAVPAERPPLAPAGRGRSRSRRRLRTPSPRAPNDGGGKQPNRCVAWPKAQLRQHHRPLMQIHVKSKPLAQPQLRPQPPPQPKPLVQPTQPTMRPQQPSCPPPNQVWW
jgi:hypothetical protein